MPEIGTSGSMSGDGKRAIGKASSTAPILDSIRGRSMASSGERHPGIARDLAPHFARLFVSHSVVPGRG